MPTASPAKDGPMEAETRSPLTSRTILKFYFPLAISWIFMAIEMPVCISAISRRPNPEINTAALLILMNIALWVESPIIDLLSTSTTLAKNRTHFLELRSFVTWLIVLVTVAHALIAFTPLYWGLTEGLIGVTHEVAANARVALQLMLPWAGSIAWRRYLQGILIRHGQTRFVGFGTGVRVLAMSLAVFTLYNFTSLPGVELAGIALICGVASEATFIQCAARGTIRREFAARHESEHVIPLGTRKLVSFHLPLTLTTLVTLCSVPIVSAALARMPNPILMLAAYQVGSSVLWLLRSFTYALPEVVITLYRDEQSAKVLKRFCLITGCAASGILLLLTATGADQVYFSKVLGTSEEVAQVAHLAFFAGILLPLIGANQSYVRGMLTAHHLTVSRLTAIGLSMIVLGVVLVIGVKVQANGVLNAGLALTLALLAELGVLAYSWKKGKAQLEPVIS